MPAIMTSRRGTLAKRPKISTLVDTFDSADTGKWTGYGANITVSSSRLSVNPTSAFPTLQSIGSYDLTGSAAYVEFVQAASGSSVGTYFVLAASTNNLIVVRYQVGNLVSSVRISGTDFDRNTATYSSTNHRWLRMRESAGSVYWDTSPDGSSWTQFGSSWTPAFALTSLRVQFVAGSTGTGPALFDNLNTGGA